MPVHRAAEILGLSSEDAIPSSSKDIDEKKDLDKEDHRSLFGWFKRKPKVSASDLGFTLADAIEAKDKLLKLNTPEKSSPYIRSKIFESFKIITDSL
ncbi:hypothetical protein ADUPG1_006675 [Aduncisulcus paluster]|uniref:Uncharacterized protein n=1 Tax=Aduncisulcus paluster TaxID=2918883 RepID=A0ABQ5KJ51_9EUKA|nr:hypothetical protein ADUPG1_006675 [Aduncisulcus paluster]